MDIADGGNAEWQIHDDTGDDETHALLEQDRIWNCFALADLLPPVRAYTRFLTARRQGEKPSALLLIVRHPEIKVISPFGETAGVAALLAQSDLPDFTLVQTTAAHRSLLEAFFRPLPIWDEMLRMAVTAQTFTSLSGHERVTRLATDDSAEVSDLYQLFPESHFRTELLAQGSFHGLRENGRLLAIAGTHVIAEPYGIAVVGGVFTRPEARGQGYASLVTSALVAHLLERGCRDVVLNVYAANAPAVAVYNRLGFQTRHYLWSGQAERRKANQHEQP